MRGSKSRRQLLRGHGTMKIVKIETLKIGDRIRWGSENNWNGPYTVTNVELLKKRNNHQIYSYYNLNIYHEVLLTDFVMKLKGNSICEIVEVAQ